jgi:hypothetical protein
VSQNPTNNPGDPNAPNPAMVVRRRGASVNLRDDNAAESGPGMDVAGKSLSDALKITYRVLQVGMVALVGVFAFSGMQTINANEQGVRLLFGKIDDDSLQPGLRFSWPKPLGEIVRVARGASTVKLENAFMPQLDSTRINKTEAELGADAGAAQMELKPEVDGFLITGDLNIAHARFAVEYVRDPLRVRDYLLHVQNDEVQAFDGSKFVMFSAVDAVVRTAVQRGAVLAAAGMSIDELRKDTPDEELRKGQSGLFVKLEDRTRQLAQEMLDDMKSGLRINSLKLERKMVPIRLFNDFNKVEDYLSQASGMASGADRDRQTMLAKTAGEAAPLLLKLIDQFEAAHGQGDSAKADAILDQIDAVLEGKPVTIEGEKVIPRVGGDVAVKMFEAQQYRSSIVSRAQTDASVFAAKLAAFKANPAVVLTGDWSEAVATFLSRDSVQVFLSDARSPTTVWLNRDPEIQKLQDAARAKRMADEMARQSMKENAENKFKPIRTEGGVKVEGGGS